MISILIPNGIIHLANTNFTCPYCNKEYNDFDDKYINRCNKNQNNCTKIFCSCEKSFMMTYDMTGDAVTFK